MSYRPRTAIAACPCGADPRVKYRRIFTGDVRLECKCGVAGQWRSYSGRGDPWHDAVAGWSKVFPTLETGQAPRAPRK